MKTRGDAFPDTVICDMLDQVSSVDMLFFKRGTLSNFLFDTDRSQCERLELSLRAILKFPVQTLNL